MQDGFLLNFYTSISSLKARAIFKLYVMAESLLTKQYIAQAIENIQKLISYPSITPDHHGCLDYLINWLKKHGFVCEKISKGGVDNLIAYKKFDNDGPNFAFAGHIDVVPADELSWKHPPFSGVISEGKLYGRGAVDMKGSIGCFMSATESVLKTLKKGTLYWLLTCDEEGEAEFGTKIMVEALNKKGIVLDYCLVGEPTATSKVGDVIKVGRRGAISAKINFSGKAGHVAYPLLADNALHKAVNFSNQLLQFPWYLGTQHQPGNTLQITYLTTSDFTDNIVPPQAELCFNIRFNSSFDLEEFKSKTINLLHSIDPHARILWQRLCIPYQTVCEAGKESFTDLVSSCIQELFDMQPSLSISGGTSDGRFIANQSTQVIELGPSNKTIHQINENISISEISDLFHLYEKILIKIHSEHQ